MSGKPTKARQLIDTLTGLTKEHDVRTLTTLASAEEQRLKHLTELKHDLQASDPKKRALDLSAKATRFDMVAAHLTALNDDLGLSAMSQFSAARNGLQAARLVLSTLRSAALTADLLPGTGGDEWRSMWDATKAFAVVAYPDSSFPPSGDDAQCPFCQQQIQPDTASRLYHFAEFVTSTAQAVISILPVPDGTVIHPTAAERTKFCSSHKRPAPETVTQPALTCDRLEPLFSGHFSDTSPHVRRVFA